MNQLQMQEIRTIINTRFPSELAESGGNDLVMRAIETAPFRLIGDPAIIEAGKAARARHQSPERAKLLNQL